MGKLHIGFSHGPAKGIKRKLAPTRDLNGPLLENSLQRLVKAPIDGALKVDEVSPNNMGLEKDDKGALKTNTKNSVKGKKALARAKATQNGSSDAFRLADQKTPLSS